MTRTLTDVGITRLHGDQAGVLNQDGFEEPAACR